VHGAKIRLESQDNHFLFIGNVKEGRLFDWWTHTVSNVPAPKWLAPAFSQPEGAVTDKFGKWKWVGVEKMDDSPPRTVSRRERSDHGVTTTEWRDCELQLAVRRDVGSEQHLLWVTFRYPVVRQQPESLFETPLFFADGFKRQGPGFKAKYTVSFQVPINPAVNPDFEPAYRGDRYTYVRLRRDSSGTLYVHGGDVRLEVAGGGIYLGTAEGGKWFWKWGAEDGDAEGGPPTTWLKAAFGSDPGAEEVLRGGWRKAGAERCGFRQCERWEATAPGASALLRRDATLNLVVGIDVTSKGEVRGLLNVSLEDVDVSEQDSKLFDAAVVDEHFRTERALHPHRPLPR
jgi:hypothetical protein